tara:strand:- start:369 stop:677 length:309 start_codon:yes stop_codon:yes gene_type:complete
MYKIDLTIDDKCNFEMFDKYMTNIFSKRKTIDILRIDTTPCSMINAKQIMTLVPVINKHRENSKRFLKQTEISVANVWVARLLRCVLPIMKPEQPTHVVVKK